MGKDTRVTTNIVGQIVHTIKIQRHCLTDEKWQVTQENILGKKSRRKDWDWCMIFSLCEDTKLLRKRTLTLIKGRKKGIGNIDPKYFLKFVLWESVKLLEDCFDDITRMNYNFRMVTASVGGEGDRVCLEHSMVRLRQPSVNNWPGSEMTVPLGKWPWGHAFELGDA